MALAKAAARRQRARSMEQTKFTYQGPNDEGGGVSGDQKPPDHVARSEEEEDVKSLTVASGGGQRCARTAKNSPFPMPPHSNSAPVLTLR